MTNGPSAFSCPSGSSVPNKRLTVKCKYNTSRGKLTFDSAHKCTYDVLWDKIRERFDLTAPFEIQWKDDDGEHICIRDESTLNEAIDFHHSGDEGSVASSGSVFTSRSSLRSHRITMPVEIRLIDYVDCPSLSDTASLASRDEDSPEGSQISFTPGELSGSPQDDDAVTVSSKDARAHQTPRQGRGDSSLIRKLWNSPSRAGCSSTPNKPTLKPSRSRIFKIVSRASTTEDQQTAGSSTRDNRAHGRSSDSLIDTEKRYPKDPSDVFALLKLEEQRSPDLSHDRSFVETDTWLKDQHTLRKKATLGTIPPITDDSFSLNTNSPLSDTTSDTDILLEKDERGKYYYKYTGSGSSDSAGELEYEFVNGTQPVNEAGIPEELLIPEEVTDCSNCGHVLDQIKYTCTTCGEKTPMSRAALHAAAVGMGKGKSRASPDHHDHGNAAEYELQESKYPPRCHRSPGTLYTPSNSTHTLAYPSNSKPLPALPSASPTRTIFGRSHGSQSTLVPSSSSGSSSPTTRVGYELCAVCFEKVGLDHALPGGLDSPSSPTLPPTPQELAIARRSAPKRKGELRHAFLFQIWGFNGWQVIEQDEISHNCSGCDSILSGKRYKCAVCENFTICRACYNDVHNIHPIHPFLERRVKPPSRSYSRPEGLPVDDDEAYDNVDEPSLKHPDVRCFNCQQDIIGARFHCLDCTTIDIDICSNCDSAGLPGNLEASDCGHHFSHMLLKIPVPMNTNEVQHVSQRAHGLRHGRDRADLRGVSPLMRSSPGSVSSLSVGTVLRADNGGGENEEEDYVHLQVCNSCGEPIIGIRYQCLSCPSIPNSYNLCSDCETKSYKVHDPMHTFLKIPRPVDIPGPLESEFPIIPVLYRDPGAGPTPGSPAADISGDPAAYLRELTHSFALCDRDMVRIVGKWYRCAFCAKDLCADCEALDSHDDTHVFLVFKAPVDMQSFRLFADLENPAGSPPVLQRNIYIPRHD